MKLLILTQAVDRDDPVLGFFHRWIEEFSPRYEKITVVCLKKGRFELPKNVSVFSLGKERGVSRVTYLFNFYRYIWMLRKQYDSVFVHMNQEYVILGWKLWWLLGKPVTLWRNHQKGGIWTRIAGFLVRRVFYTSPQAYVSGFRNALRMPIGIDTESFAPKNPPEKNSVLFLGRLDPVKKPEVFVAALKKLHEEKVVFRADMYGAPTYAKAPHVQPLAALAAPLVVEEILSVLPSVANEQTPVIYAAHDVYVNLTPSGSFDKTIGEAMSAGCVVVAVNDALRAVMPKQLLPEESVPAIVESIRWALALTADERTKITTASRDYIVREHSLALLTRRLAEEIHHD